MIPSSIRSDIEKCTRYAVVLVVCAFIFLSGLSVAKGIGSDVDSMRADREAVLVAAEQGP